MDNAEARGLLATVGAHAEGNIVRIPPGIIEQALATTPPSFKVWGRDQEQCMTVALDHINFGPGLTNTDFVDPTTGARRRTRRGDPATTARVCDATNWLVCSSGSCGVWKSTPTRSCLT